MNTIELEARRARIDRIDSVLVRLVAARQREVAVIAALKTGPDSVRDPARIAAILTRVKSAAQRCGLDEAIAIAVWRELLERSAESQETLIAQANRPIHRLDEVQAAASGSSTGSPLGSSMQAVFFVRESP